MSNKKNKWNRPSPPTPSKEAHGDNVENKPPEMQWQNVEHFWHSCVKNGSPLLLESFKSHLKSLGWDSKPEKYLEGALHFGIEIEK